MDFITGDDGTGLVIDWAQMPTYNTIMSVAAGAGLILLVMLGRALTREKVLRPEGWAVASGVLGVILTLTGAHMTLTWPLAPDFAFDNIVFGETSLGFGVLLLGASFLLWKRGAMLAAAADPGAELAAFARPISIFVAGLGLGLFGIAAAGIVFQLFAAPPAEPISGAFAQWPVVEATFMSLLFALIGLGAVLFPFALRSFSSHSTVGGVAKAMGVVWLVTGVIFVLFGAMNFYTHIGLIVNTMG